MATRFTRHPNTAGRIIEGQAYIVTAEHSKMLTLNPAATLLWNLAESGCTADEATLAVMETFEVDQATARADVETCLADLVRRAVLVAS